MNHLTLIEKEVTNRNITRDSLPAVWGDFNPHCPQLRQAVEKTRRWIGAGFPAGESLLLSGDTGTGKTRITKVIAAVLTSLGKRVKILPEPALFASIRDTYATKPGESENQLFKSWFTHDLIILDDLGAAHVRDDRSTWIEDIYWRLLDRTDTQSKFIDGEEIVTPPLAFVITTNLQKNDLQKRLGERGFSRLMGAMRRRENIINLFDVSDYRTRWLDG